jgi:hypothetical protein
MFKIDEGANPISPLEVKRFSDLGFTERKHLQEWLENYSQIEADFGAALTWVPLRNKKACRVQYAKPVDGYNQANWSEMIQWLVEHITRLESALKEPLLEKIRQALRQADLRGEAVQ